MSTDGPPPGLPARRETYCVFVPSMLPAASNRNMLQRLGTTLLFSSNEEDVGVNSKRKATQGIEVQTSLPQCIGVPTG